MHVLMSVAEMGSGGAEAIVADLSGALLSDQHRVLLATAGGWRTRDLSAAGVRLLEVPLQTSRPGPMMRSALTMRRQLRDVPLDVIHAHNIRATLVTHIGLRWPGRAPPLLTTVHGLPEADYRRAARVLSRCSDVAVAVSDGVARSLENAGFPSHRLIVIENAAVTPASHDRAAARDRLGLPHDVPVVLCAARMAGQKRHDLLLEAWSKVPERAILLIAGDGPTRGAVEAAVESGSFGQRVRLLGDRQDLDWLLAAADMLVLPSDWEGLPMTVLEALGAGVPVVASAVGALPGLGVNALHLVTPGSADALAAGMTELMASRTRQEALIENGRQLIATRFAPNTMRSGYREVYERLSHRH